MDLKKIIQYNLPEDQYHRVIYTKNQIVVHHTASGPSAEGVVNYWKSNPDAIATAFIIENDGDIYQAFSSKYYAAHLGVTASAIKAFGFNDYGSRCDVLHKASIGIELCNWGGLTKDRKGRWVSYDGAVIPDDNVQLYPAGFRGYYAYEKYTPKQIAALKELLSYLCDTYKISKEYKIGDFAVSKRAIGGENGIWTHCNYRPASDKQDLHPQPEMIETLKSIS